MKRGVGFVMSIALLTLWLAVMLPVLRPAVSTQAAPWIFAIALIPIAVVIPWLFLIVSRALDRGWLGRRFAPGGGALALQGCAPIGDDRGTADRARARRA